MEIIHLPFLELIQDITSKFNKIPNKDFINEGEYAIIDQGANIIAGYTNDKSIITDLGYPVIIFGDHTRIIKYINYPFAIGADGVKVLSVDTEKAYPLYVFYYLKFLKIPNAGYSRHYKFLKEKKIALPKDIDNQKRIAKMLSQCEALIQKRKESIGLLDEFIQSSFLEMFGDLITIDKGWEKVPLGKHLKIKHGFAFKSEFFTSIGSHVLLTPGNFYEEGGYKDRGEKQKYYVGDISSEYILNKGDLLIAMTEQTPGLLGSAILVPESEKFLHNQRLGLVKFDPAIYNSRFLFHLFNSKRVRDIIHSKATGMKVRHTSPTKIESIIIFNPPFTLQNQFAKISEKTELIKKYFESSLLELKSLYGSISQKAFKGELDLSKVDISDIKDSKKKNIEEVKEDLTEEQFEALLASFEHTLPTGEVSSNRQTEIRNMSIRQYLRLPDNEETEGMEFYHMDKDYFYQFILKKGFPEGTFTLQDIERYAGNYILEGTGFEFTYDNWKTIIFRFIGAKQPIIEQLFDEETKTIKLKLTNEAFKV